MNDWDLETDHRPLTHARFGDVILRPDDRVLLRPLGRADILDLALDGKAATIASIEQDFEGRIYLAVTLDDDPGRDLGLAKQPGHRFFFGVEEVELRSPTSLAVGERNNVTPAGSMNMQRILIAGVGNIFFGDDAFGVEVIGRLAKRPLPPGVKAVDFGIRGIDLTYALLEPYDVVILVDAVARGGEVGTLYVLEPEVGAADGPAGPEPPILEPHALDPAKVLRLARSLGGTVDRIFLVGCEIRPPASEEDFAMEMSPPVQAAVLEAVGVVESLVAKIRGDRVKSCTSYPSP